MKWQNAEKDSENKLLVPSTWLIPHYYDALTVLFRVENALRLFVYVILKDRYGPKWKDLEISSDEEAKTTIGALAKRRIEQSKTFGYVSYPIQSPLMYLTSGELVRLIIHDSYWPDFKDYFLAAKNVTTLKLQEIGIIRNALAHFRPLSNDDVEVVKQNANQMLSVVEKTLIDLIQCVQNVPTNTSDEWYIQLHTLGTELVSLGFSQSNDESWVRISFRQNLVVASGTPQPRRRWQHYRVAYIDAPALLKIQPILRNSVLFLTESSSPIRMGNDLFLKGRKDVHLTFSRRVLSDAYVDIQKAIKEILALITQETELLKEDQLARGKLVRLRGVTAQLKGSEDSSFWSINQNVLTSQPPLEELPEYWGQIGAGENFVSNTEFYPWIPVRVSEEDFPFLD